MDKDQIDPIDTNYLRSKAENAQFWLIIWNVGAISQTPLLTKAPKINVCSFEIVELDYNTKFEFEI